MKTSHLIIGAAILIGLSQCGKVTTSVQETSERNQLKAEIGSSREDFKSEAREKAKNSQAALEAARAGCFPVFDIKSGKPSPFGIGELVIDQATQRAFPGDTFVCNELGLVAKVGDEGTVIEVYQVKPADMPEYQRYYNAQLTKNFEGVQQ